MAKKKKQDTTALKDLVIRLGQEPSLMSAYIKCPDGVMLGAGVPEEQVKIVLSGNQDDIAALLGDDHLAITIIHTQKC